MGLVERLKEFYPKWDFLKQVRYIEISEGNLSEEKILEEVELR